MAMNEKASNEELVATLTAVLQKATEEQRLYLAGSSQTAEYMVAAKAVEQ